MEKFELPATAQLGTQASITYSDYCGCTVNKAVFYLPITVLKCVKGDLGDLLVIREKKTHIV